MSKGAGRKCATVTISRRLVSARSSRSSNTTELARQSGNCPMSCSTLEQSTWLVRKKATLRKPPLLSEGQSAFATRARRCASNGVKPTGDPWFQVMVGQWWTPATDLGVVGAAATKRQVTCDGLAKFLGAVAPTIIGIAQSGNSEGNDSGQSARLSPGAPIRPAVSRKQTVSSANPTALLTNAPVN